MRKKLFDIIEIADDNNKISHFYDLLMIVAIVVSLIPLFFKETIDVFNVIENITVVIFVVDYMLRWFTADYKLSKGAWSFVAYPFSFMAIVDLLSILPAIIMISSAFKTLRVLRLTRALRVFRVFKSFRYSKNIAMIAHVFKKQKRSLMTVFVLAIGYIVVSALLVFNVEPDTFNTFFDALYWSTISLTTVGYGDIFTVSVAGRVITMISAIVGVAIVALPAGIITAGYMTELQKQTDEQESKNE